MTYAMVSELLRLLAGSVIYRPYVYIFFAGYLVFAIHHLGARLTALFTISTFLITFACEYSSTRNGFPFGLYTYIDDTRARELWIANVPFWDSLSFVFLSYFSMTLASRLIGRLESYATPVLGGVLMMCLDFVIDPVALQGHRWFLGRIYYYPNGGPYFGVTLENFAGWFFVGFVTQAVFIAVACALGQKWRRLNAWFYIGALSVYAGVFLFNLCMTFAIADYPLFGASLAITAFTLTAIGFGMKRRKLTPCAS